MEYNEFILPEEINLDNNETEDGLYVEFLAPEDEDNARDEFRRVNRIIHEVERETGYHF